MSTEPIQMWRDPVSEVKKGGPFSVIEDRGQLTLAIPSSKTGNYLFAEIEGKGTPATRPLVLIGRLVEIVAFLIENKDKKIENRIADLPDIYFGMVPYKPKERFRSLFPLEDFGIQFFSQLVEFAPGLAGIEISEFLDAAGIPSKLGELWSSIQKLKERDNANSSNDNIILMKFSYLPEEGMQRIATGELSLAKLLNILKIGGTKIGTPARKIA